MITRKIARQLAPRFVGFSRSPSTSVLLFFLHSLPIMSDGDKKVRTESKRKFRFSTPTKNYVRLTVL